MRCGSILFFFLFICTATSVAQEYYIRGTIKDSTGRPLQNVQIRQTSTGLLFKSGVWGSFGFTSSKLADTLLISLSGFRAEKIITDGATPLQVVLSPLPLGQRFTERTRLSSRTANMSRDQRKGWFTGDETYADLLENKWVSTSAFPTTGLSLTVDQASYSNIRRFISRGTYVPADAVRVEEIFNYFPPPYVPPVDSAVFSVSSNVGPCPWNWNNHLLQINLSARKLNLDSLPPTHLVFLIDISASMDMPNRLPLLQAGFRMLLSNLREKDSVSIVVYGGMTAVLVRALSGCERDSLTTVINGLVPGGATPGESGIRLAYQVAKQHYIEGGNNRVILATDGDFNVGLKTETELEELISIQREQGIYLTCLGVGMGNYKDSKIQLLAERGNGNFAYLDQEKEAERVLMMEFTKTLYAVADDVYMNMSFDPSLVKSYRLIGFANKAGALLDSLAQIEGGEVGSGHTLTALFEIEPTAIFSSVAYKKKDLDSIAQLQLLYQLPNDTVQRKQQVGIPLYYVYLEQELKQSMFMAALAQFGMLLKGSPFLNKSSWTDLVQLGEQVIDTTSQPQVEWLTLIKQCQTLYDKKRKRSWKRLRR
ncbi:MAG: von Willebrand factor type A domain-containing protein [Bacteroidetes bacterium]|nr:von Willebrand factor type A domain-containing protein [Bacteroidota bacterium]